MLSASNLSITYMELLTCVSLPLNIQLKFAGGTESAMHCSVTLLPGAAADGPVIDMLCGPTAKRKRDILMFNLITKF